MRPTITIASAHELILTVQTPQGAHPITLTPADSLALIRDLMGSVEQARWLASTPERPCPVWEIDDEIPSHHPSQNIARGDHHV